jgi:hypothetical protein
LATLDAPAYGAASDVTPKFVSPSDPETGRFSKKNREAIKHEPRNH